jgi:hypothetical protein
MVWRRVQAGSKVERVFSGFYILKGACCVAGAFDAFCWILAHKLTQR